MGDNTESTAIVKAEPLPDLNIQEFGRREDIAALGNRIRAMMPGGEKLKPQEAMAAAQYALTLGANPFRGETYAYTDSKGKLQLVEGYKLLVRWARRQCEYAEWYKPLENIGEQDVGFSCFILRQDKHDLLQTLLKAGMDLDRAMDIVTVSAGGVVRSNEMQGYNAPPKGWTWEDVAKKRALKNALNKSHGIPSLQEIASESWRVNGHDTEPDDWEDVTARMSPAEAEATAEYNAKLREIHEAEPTVANAAEAEADLFGEDEFNEPLEGEAEPAPIEVEAETMPVAHIWVIDEAQRFFRWTRREKGLPDAEVLRALSIKDSMANYHGSYEDAVATIEDYTHGANDGEQIPFPEEDANAG